MAIACRNTARVTHRGDRRAGPDWTGGDQLSADVEISCPSARKSVSAYGEVGMSAVRRLMRNVFKLVDPPTTATPEMRALAVAEVGGLVPALHGYRVGPA
jgi:hypothetical protein